MKSSTKKVLKRAAIVTGTMAAGAGALVVIQKIAAKNGVSIGITPEQITPENETISKIVSGTVAGATGLTAGILLGEDIIAEKKEKNYLETIIKQDESLKRMQKLAEEEDSATRIDPYFLYKE